ncbi:MAG: hypothetical protein QOF85_964 [Solirubrobacterales bacterium]|jgi:hypothetical protein|nr:hypothetical protein [Solirubrobacterales bacterium]
MKKHARHVTLGGVVGPLVLAIAAAIANEAQTLLGLHLDNQALAIFIAPFLLGAAAVLHGQLRLEGQKLMAELGKGELDLGGLLGAVGDIFGDTGESTSTPQITPNADVEPPAAPTLPPPPSPPPS